MLSPLGRYSLVGCAFNHCTVSAEKRDSMYNKERNLHIYPEVDPLHLLNQADSSGVGGAFSSGCGAIRRSGEDRRIFPLGRHRRRNLRICLARSTRHLRRSLPWKLLRIWSGHRMVGIGVGTPRYLRFTLAGVDSGFSSRLLGLIHSTSKVVTIGSWRSSAGRLLAFRVLHWVPRESEYPWQGIIDPLSQFFVKPLSDPCARERRVVDTSPTC
jgi:hypothetical protein